jgi:hypothetical protein
VKQKVKDFFDIVKTQMKINSLENEIETLTNSIKDELYKEFLKKLGDSAENERLKKENKNLRKKVKVLKEIIKEGK